MNLKSITAGLVGLLFFYNIVVQTAHANGPYLQKPVISIIIDDLGNSNNPRHEDFVKLPGAITCAFLPQNKASIHLAEIAHDHNKEVMLHLPMQSIDGKPMGPGGLSEGMSREQVLKAIKQNLESVPYVIGINNHMGSLLTRNSSSMNLVMKEIKRKGNLFFVDSRTTANSVAMSVAQEHGIPGSPRDIFLDHDNDINMIRAQFYKTILRARTKGSALAIGHPYGNTLTVLKEMLPKLREMGIRLVAVSELIRFQHERQKSWQASLSPSQKDVKN